MALVVRADFHWLSGKRVKVNSRWPASSKLSATSRHFGRHLRMNGWFCCNDDRLMKASRDDTDQVTLRGHLEQVGDEGGLASDVY